jgi:hypothetical protein
MYRRLSCLRSRRIFDPAAPIWFSAFRADAALTVCQNENSLDQYQAWAYERLSFQTRGRSFDRLAAYQNAILLLKIIR